MSRISKWIIMCCLIAFGSLPSVVFSKSHSTCHKKGHTHHSKSPTIAKGILSHKELYFTDANGKVVILHGMNFMNKNPPFYPVAFDEPNPNGQGTIGESWAKLFADNGFNVVRLGIMWQGVEPSAGNYDDSYIRKIRDISRIFGKFGVFVILDFHQDGWTFGPIPGLEPNPNFFGAGFPIWSANFYLNGVPQQNLNGENFNNPALNAIWNNFWNNVPAFTDNSQTTRDTIGVQDRFINMHVHVAKFFKNEKNLLYYGSVNQPLPDIQTFESLEEPTLVDLLLNTDFGAKAGHWPPSILLQNNFFPFTAPPFNSDFFLTFFYNFHEKLDAAILKVDPVHMIGREITFYELLGKIPVVPKPTESNIVLARSGYGIESAPHPQNELVFDLSPAIAQRNNMGFFVQEWGALLEGDNTVNAYPPVVKYFDQQQLSWCYWDFAQFASTFPVQSQTFNDVTSVAGWYVEADNSPLGQLATISWNSEKGNPPGSMQLTIPAVAESQQTFKTTFQAGDLSTAPRTISVDIIVDPSSGTPAGSYEGFILLFTFNGSSEFVTQLQGTISIGLNHFEGPLVAPVDNVTSMGILVVNFAGGPAKLYVDNVNISGPAFQLPVVQDVIYGTNVPATGKNVNTAVLNAITEPYPRVIAGTPISYGYDPLTQLFTFEYSTRRVIECGKYPDGSLTEIAVPARNYPNGYHVRVKGGRVVSKKNSSVLLIRSENNADEIKVVITPR